MLPRGSVRVRVAHQVMQFAAVHECEVFGPDEVAEDAFDRIPVRRSGVVKELSEC